MLEDGKWRHSNYLTRWQKAEAQVPHGWGSPLRLQKPSKALELREPGNSKGQGGADGRRIERKPRKCPVRFCAIFFHHPGFSRDYPFLSLILLEETHRSLPPRWPTSPTSWIHTPVVRPHTVPELVYVMRQYGRNIGMSFLRLADNTALLCWRHAHVLSLLNHWFCGN